MWIILVKRDKLIFPIMDSDEGGETSQTMATWETEGDAIEYSEGSQFCRASETFVIDMDDIAEMYI